MQYEDMEIEAFEVTRERTSDNKWEGHFKVRVLHSPAGEMKLAEAVPVTYDYQQLRADLLRLERGTLNQEQFVHLGRVLALLLLPPGEEGSPANVRGFLAHSLIQVGSDKGIRLRLRLPPELAAVPWEYMYVERAGGGDGMDGFLALDPRVALVRHETLSVPSPLPQATGVIKMVAVLASNVDLPPLDLAKERADLEETFAGQEGIEPLYLENATLAAVQSAIPGTTIFHFAGHGMFTQEILAAQSLGRHIALVADPSMSAQKMAAWPSTGVLALDDQLVGAEALGINLRGNGVRLAVLGGCETGRRAADGSSVWSGIAPALVKAEVPAVVANQYTIQDRCAIAFSQQFYQALVGGLPIERAVTAGRIAAYNTDPTGRDWGVPVLYLRAADGQLFEGASDTALRQQARAAAEVKVNVRVKDVAAGGEVLGAEVGKILAGTLDINVEANGVVYGRVVGLHLDILG